MQRRCAACAPPGSATSAIAPRKGREQSELCGCTGGCRDQPARSGPAAVRFRVAGTGTVSFTDRFQGHCSFEMAALGDVVLRRRDQLFAYQLAVVVDDAAQGVTDVVRGADLLPSTAWQILLQRALDILRPVTGICRSSSSPTVPNSPNPAARSRLMRASGRGLSLTPCSYCARDPRASLPTNPRKPCSPGLAPTGIRPV